MKKTKLILSLLTGMLFSSFFAVAVGVPILAPVLFAGSLGLHYIAPVGSMFSLVTGTPITFTGEEAREFIIEPALEHPEMTTIHSIVTDVVADKQIAFSGRLSKLTKKDAGCGAGQTNKTIPMSEKKWQPVGAKIWLTQCSDDAEDTLFAYKMNTGVKRKDLTDTDFNEFVIDLMTTAGKDDLMRFGWFGDKDIDWVGGAGTLTLAADIVYYNIIDGFWKQIFAGVAATTTPYVAIPENALLTYAAQDALAANRAYLTFRGLLEKADKRLMGDSSKFILCTDSLWQNWLAYKETQNMDMSFVRQGEFYATDVYRGVTIIAMFQWDVTIRADFDDGDVYMLPHRALLTTKANIPFGLDGSANAVSEFDVFFDKTTELNNYKGAYKVDAKLVHEFMACAAY